MKIGLIYQPCGLGDILFLQKLGYKMKEMGYEVYWPVVCELEWLNDYIPDFNFIAQDTKEKRIARPPLADEIQFPFKEYYRTENPTTITDELYFYNGFIEEGGPAMAGKYNKIGMDWGDYRDYIKFNRNIEKENELYYNVLGLEDGEEYVLVNRTFATRPHLMFYENISVSPEHYGCRVVEMKVLPDYTLFDWFKVFANARDVEMIESAPNYFLESPQLYDIMKTKNLSLYLRPWGTWSSVDYLHKLPWKYN